MLYQISWIYILMFCTFLFSSCGENVMTSEDHLQEALNFEDDNKFREALYELNDAIRLDPGKSNLYAFRGKILEFLEDDSLALLDLNRAIQLNPNNISAYYYKGIALTYLKDYGLAIQNFNKAISLKTKGEIIFDIKPNDFQSFEEKVDIEVSAIKFNRGIAFFESGQYKTAVNDFYAAMTGNFNVALCKYYIGVIYIKQNDQEKGCSFLKEAIQAGSVEAKEEFPMYCK